MIDVSSYTDDKASYVRSGSVDEVMIVQKKVFNTVLKWSSLNLDTSKRFWWYISKNQKVFVKRDYLI